MWQEWKALLFLHWRYPAEAIQASLPPGLQVDEFEGQAYVGIVPFFMRRVRPVHLPSLPWISNFPELNVRTYVRDEAGRPGVWFYSLDCNRWPAVATARALFHLRYFHSRMDAAHSMQSGQISYQCLRRGRPAAEKAVYRYGGIGPAYTASHGSLEFFLTERYRLFAWNPRRKVLATGEVFHAPYPLQSAVAPEWSSNPMLWNGWTLPGRPPDHCLFSAGVAVGIFPLRTIQTRDQAPPAIR